MSELTADPTVSSATPNERQDKEQEQQQESQHQLHDESIKNASTEVLVDTTILDRLAALHIIGDNNILTKKESLAEDEAGDLATPIPSTPPQEVADNEDACPAVASKAADDLDKPTLDQHNHNCVHEQNKQQIRSEANNNKLHDQSNSQTPPLAEQKEHQPPCKNDADIPKAELDEAVTPPLTPRKRIEKSAELTRSILAGEVSDTSECSVDVDNDEEDDTREINVTKVSEASNGKLASSDVSDEEMFIEDQEEEDVEEEEEFHDIEEEKHKTSQEFVDADKNSPLANTTSTPTSAVKDTHDESEKPCDASVNQASITDNHSQLQQRSNETSSDEKTVDPKISIKSEPEQVANGFKPKASNSDWADIMLSNIKTSAESNSPSPADENSADPIEEGTQVVEDVDGQEKQSDEAEKKKLDLDEDVKNPQYIPKKGVFYEHDDRSHDVEGDKQTSTTSKKGDDGNEVKESPGTKKLLSQDKQNDNRRGNRRQQRTDSERWGHDLFRDERQKPKSKNEQGTPFGYDGRHERSGRNQGDHRRGPNTNADRQQISQDSQRSRQNRDNRTPRSGQAPNRSRERKPRRQNNRNRNDSSLGTPSKRDGQQVAKPAKTETQDTPKTDTDVRQQQQPGLASQHQSNFQSIRRDNRDGSSRDRNNRNDNRNRRQNSKDRPNINSNEIKLPPITTVMPPITTWSNKIEDMVKEDALNASPARQNQQNNHNAAATKSREHSEDQWPVNNPSKNHFQDRTARNINDNRHQQQQPQYNSRGRYQDRDNEPHRQMQFVNRSHYGDRSNQQNRDWGRNNNYNSYSKQNEPIKTQTFENSRLSQSNMNRNIVRDGRDIINERRMQGQQNFASKGLTSGDQQLHQQRQLQHTQYLQQLAQQQNHQTQHHQQQMMQHIHHHHQQQPSNQHLRQQQPNSQNQQQSHMAGSGHSNVNATQPPQQTTSNNPRNSQQPSQAHGQAQSSQQQARSTMVMSSNMTEGSAREPARITHPAVSSSASELISSRPIIKTDTYNAAGVQPPAHSQQPSQQGHRSLGGPHAQPGGSNSAAGVAATPMAPVPPHMGPTGSQTQYYPPPNSTRDAMAAAAAAAAASASAYHGYMPGGHSVMDTNTRYHMSSHDHYVMAGPGQGAMIPASSVMHQPGMYGNATGAGGGTVASSAYMTQPGSTLSPSSNIPVTGAGPPPPMDPYLQHSQYAPPPYSNPYTQPQHDHQAPPPQSNQAYPYWAYN